MLRPKRFVRMTSSIISAHNLKASFWPYVKASGRAFASVDLLPICYDSKFRKSETIVLGIPKISQILKIPQIWEFQKIE